MRMEEGGIPIAEGLEKNLAYSPSQDSSSHDSVNALDRMSRAGGRNGVFLATAHISGSWADVLSMGL
jgi:hypothetical protein